MRPSELSIDHHPGMVEMVCMSQNPKPISTENLERELAGFPDDFVQLVRDFCSNPTTETLRPAVLKMLGHYRPAKSAALPLTDIPDSTLLREELGVDSLGMAEAAFKMEDLWGITVDILEVSHVNTLGELLQLLHKKMEISS